MNARTIILSLAFCLSVVNCAPNDEVAAEVFLKDSSDILYKAVNRIADIMYNITHFETINETSSEESSLEMSSDVFMQILYKLGMLTVSDATLMKYSIEAGKFKYNEFKNPELQMGLQHIHMNPGKLVLDTDDLDEIEESIRTKKNICSFKNEASCNLNFDEDISDIIRETNDPKELQYYWNEWRSKNQDLFKKYLTEVVQLIKKGGEYYKVSPSMQWFNPYFENDFIDEMEKVVTELQPFYQELHAFVRTILIKEYGTDAVLEGGVIPAHLFEKIQADAWSEKGIISNIVTTNNLVNMKKILKEKNFTARKIVDLANDFFMNLGFEELPNEFWEKHVKELEDDEKDDLDCRSTIYDNTPKPFLKYCPEVDIRKFLQMHGWMARLHYANQKKNLLFAFFKSYDIEYAVGEAAILSTMTPKHMNSLGLITGTKYAEDDFDMARLLRLSIHTVLKIPIYYIHARIINDLVSDNVKFENINTHYWNLMKKYAGVSPVDPIVDDEITFSNTFYKGLEHNFYTTYFISDVMGYQIYEGLCDKSSYEELHKCDFSDSKEAGEILKKMMSTGSKKPWRELLSIVTGNTNGMSAKPVIHYYLSLQNWMSNQNFKSNTTIGWV